MLTLTLTGSDPNKHRAPQSPCLAFLGLTGEWGRLRVWPDKSGENI